MLGSLSINGFVYSSLFSVSGKPSYGSYSLGPCRLPVGIDIDFSWTPGNGQTTFCKLLKTWEWAVTTKFDNEHPVCVFAWVCFSMYCCNSKYLMLDKHMGPFYYFKSSVIDTRSSVCICNCVSNVMTHPCPEPGGGLAVAVRACECVQLSIF